jgi:benzylsuccinate CoA-transferase BbsF subunit
VTGALPLAGIRVADMSRVVAGPYGGYILARMGAEVIRLEDYDPVDSTRDFGPFSDDARDPNRAGYFASLNGGKKSVSVHFSDSAQAAIAREVLSTCDAMIENFPTGGVERFGLGFDTLLEANPAFVMVSISGFGRDSEMRSYRAYMNTVAAFAGLTSTNGYEGGPPKPVGATFSDFATGMAVALATATAVRRARLTGKGEHVDISMAEATLSLMAEPLMDYFVRGRVATRQGNSFASHAPAGVYRCRGEDKWVALSIANDGQWLRLVTFMGAPAWATAPEFGTAQSRFANRAALDAHLQAWTAPYESLELAVALQRAGIPAMPSSDPEDLLRNPHLSARGTIATQDFPREPGRRMPNLPWRSRRHPELSRSIPPPPVVGEHTAEILRPRGVSADLIEQLLSVATAATQPTGTGTR